MIHKRLLKASGGTNILPAQTQFTNTKLFGRVNSFSPSSNEFREVSTKLDQEMDEEETYYLRLVRNPINGFISNASLLNSSQANGLKQERSDDIFLPVYKKNNEYLFYFGIPNIISSGPPKPFSIYSSDKVFNQTITTPTYIDSDKTIIPKQSFILENGGAIYLSVEGEIIDGNFAVSSLRFFTKRVIEGGFLDPNRRKSTFPIAYKANGRIVTTGPGKIFLTSGLLTLS